MNSMRHDGLVYELAGSGPTIVVLHGGLGLDHQYLCPLVDGWDDFARVVLYDHRGNGRSTAPDDWSTITMDALVDDVDTIRRAVGAEKIHLLGHSYGGFLALQYALRYPDRLDGLMLASTAAHVRRPPTIPGDAPVSAIEAFEALFHGPMESDEQWAQTWTAAFPLYAPDVDAETAADVTAQTIYRADAWNRSAVLLGDYDVSDSLGKIEVPTLLLCGARDFLTGVEGHEELRAGIPSAELLIFDDGGHFPFLSDPQSFRWAVEDWVGRQTRGVSSPVAIT